jgi:hypothetical protein
VAKRRKRGVIFPGAVTGRAGRGRPYPTALVPNGRWYRNN